MSVVAFDSICLNAKPYPDSDFKKQSVVRGIYVWGFQNNEGKFIPVYVGKSRNVFERILQHYIRFKGGEYSIRIELQKIWAIIPKEDYKEYITTSFRDVFEFNTTDNPAKKIAEYIIQNFSFIYLEIDDNKLAEKYLAKKIGKDRTISKVPQLNELLTVEFEKKIDTVFGLYYNSPIN